MCDLCIFVEDKCWKSCVLKAAPGTRRRCAAGPVFDANVHLRGLLVANTRDSDHQQLEPARLGGGRAGVGGGKLRGCASGHPCVCCTCASGPTFTQAPARSERARSLRPANVVTQDECGKTPPLPGVRNSSEGPSFRAWCRQGYTTMLPAKSLRP